jgi:hypothetical protein
MLPLRNHAPIAAPFAANAGSFSTSPDDSQCQGRDTQDQAMGIELGSSHDPPQLHRRFP